MTIDRLPALQRDPGQMGASLGLLPDQLIEGWRQVKNISLPASYADVCHIVVCGMGGSHLAADIVRAVEAEHLWGPMTIISDYQLPAWVDKWTLVIVSSYSGSTEETIAGLKAAIRKRAKVAVVTSGGTLADMARHFNLPLFQFSPTANPSGQPRLGTAYGIVAMLAILKQLGWLKNVPDLMQELHKAGAEAVRRYGPGRSLKSNPAKQLAQKWQNSIPLLIGAEWMEGNLHTWTNQIHENAKTYAAYHLLPELNHHLLEGLRHRHMTSQMNALFVRDSELNPRTLFRYRETEKILKSLGAKISDFRPHGPTTWAKAIDLLAFGGYVSWYLAAIRRVNPAAIPTVNALKVALAKKR